MFLALMEMDNMLPISIGIETEIWLPLPGKINNLELSILDNKNSLWRELLMMAQNLKKYASLVIVDTLLLQDGPNLLADRFFFSIWKILQNQYKTLNLINLPECYILTMTKVYKCSMFVEKVTQASNFTNLSIIHYILLTQLLPLDLQKPMDLHLKPHVMSWHVKYKNAWN